MERGGGKRKKGRVNSWENMIDKTYWSHMDTGNSTVDELIYGGQYRWAFGVGRHYSTDIVQSYGGTHLFSKDLTCFTWYDVILCSNS